MSDSTLPHEKIQALGAGIAGSVNEALRDARPELTRMADRVNDSLHDLAQRSKETAQEAEHRIEREIRHAKRIAENHIHQAPLKSVLIAAGTGAAAALAVSWLMHLRKH
jgi:ElaB/YqjD/DUF883 family membrane-anchored ribosome-binding protein